ncbi:hypothetical protein B0H17DRAFT_1150291 [Mycena rosella]|uniref:Uncharacterized protein n=1 Tax=Mycena rosella TaxID=1033263 RepID=A0AAD7BVG1_MYCRO|nr:hypothetical protein B0H17DRAFT_1150291 [Mycena rosella]
MKIFILLCLLLMASLEVFCACKRGFPDTRILGIHQNICEVFIAVRAESDRRALDGESALERMRRRKKQKTDAQPQPEQSTSALDNLSEPQPLSPEPEPERVPTPPPAVNANGRPIRAKRKTWKLLQQLPEPGTPNSTRAESTCRGTAPAPPARPSWVWAESVPLSTLSDSGVTILPFRRTIRTNCSLSRNYPISPAVLAPILQLSFTNHSIRTR